MANEEHLRRLKRGVTVWNAWRNKNPGIQPDLRDADLSRRHLYHVDLTGADLRQAKFSGAGLTWAKFTGADLREAKSIGADLTWAKFTGAKLTRTVLSGATLTKADLAGATLRGAVLDGAVLSGAALTKAALRGVDLRGAILSGATLAGTDLRGAMLGWTTLGDVDLSTVRGLETVQHVGPSTIGVDTLYRSNGNIPEVFLRGAGVPEEFITYIKSLVGRPFEFYSCFISYSHADQSFARRLHDQLQGRGIRCWLDEHQLLPGDDIYEQIDPRHPVLGQDLALLLPGLPDELVGR
jgi:TIR domain/Pentapeptide repeats (8 copies)